MGYICYFCSVKLNDGHQGRALSNRVPELDMLRGIAILFVVADHCGFILPSVADYFEVPAFFIISGYLFRVRDSFLNFLSKKSCRLIIPYFFYSVLFSVLSLPLVNVSEIGVSEIFMSVLLPNNYPLWFLKALFWSMLLCFPIFALKFVESLGRAILTFLVCTSVAIVIALWPPSDLTIMTGVPQAFLALPLMIFGAILCRWPMPKPRRTIHQVVAGIAVLILCGLVWHGRVGMDSCNVDNPYVFYPYSIIVFLGFAGVTALLAKISVVAKFLGAAGKASLFIFCIHAIFIEYISVVTDNPVAIFIGVGILSAIAASLAQKSSFMKRYYLY